MRKEKEILIPIYKCHNCGVVVVKTERFCDGCKKLFPKDDCERLARSSLCVFCVDEESQKTLNCLTFRCREALCLVHSSKSNDFLNGYLEGTGFIGNIDIKKRLRLKVETNV
jgi:hypothetical protein